jgi:hypothetical protein
LLNIPDKFSKIASSVRVGQDGSRGRIKMEMEIDLELDKLTNQYNLRSAVDSKLRVK